MKKWIVLCLALAMALTLFAGCVSGDNTETTESTAESTATEETQETLDETQNAVSLPENALEILQSIWDAFGEENQFAAYGGDMETHNAKMDEDETYQIPNGPGAYDMTYGENLPYTLRIPADIIPSVDDAATLIHMMLANNFTSGALHLVEGTDAESIASAIQEELVNTQWMCGFPDRYLVAVIGGEYIVLAFGLNDAMDTFVSALEACYPDAQILYHENIA